MNPEPEPVPPLLHSVFLEGLFRSCSICGGDLLQGGVPYQIQKVWRNREVVFEMAICAPCSMQMVREFSEESMRRMQEFFERHYRADDRLTVCHFCARDIGADSDREVGAACRAGYLLRPPVVVCGECNSTVQELLSRKTREAWGEFMDRNFPGVPGVMEPENTPLFF